MARSKNPTVPVACAWWCGLAGACLLLSLAAPAGVLRDGGLPPLGGAMLVCTELAVLALVVLGVVAVSGLLSRFRRPTTPALAGLARALRIAAAGFALLLFAGSWGSFWFTGHFLDRETAAFMLGDLRTVVGYAAGINGALFAGIAALTLLAAVLSSELLPRWLARCRPLFLHRFTGGTIGAAIACAAVACGGSVLYGSSLADRRDFGSGPSTRILADLLERPAGPPGAAGRRLVRRPIAPIETGPEPAERWNVVVILVDSLRADQLRSFGGAREVMPVLDALALESRRYSDCLTTATHTDYAAPSVFSSHYPLRSRTSHACPPAPTYPRVLLYDLLKKAGYRTAIFSSQDEHWRQMIHYLDTGNLDRYFHAAEPGRRDDRPRAEFPEGTVDDATTVGEALRWIDANGEAPFFLGLNLQNAHAPYHVPSDFVRPFGPSRRDFPISFGWYPPEKTDVVRDLYDDSLAYVDTQLDRLFRHLRERGQWDRTILVVTADHGESFLEHGLVAHGGPLFAEQTRVPLILYGPGVPAGPDARPAQILDIPPTVCRALGRPVPTAFQGIDLLASGADADRSRFLVVQTPFARQYAIVRGGHKLIFDAHHRRTLLFDLASDPGENRDLSGTRPDLQRDLEDRLAAWYRAQVEYYEDRSRHAIEYPPITD